MAQESTPGPTISPFLRYEDAPAAIEFLKKAFGFEEQLVVPGPDGSVAHAQLTYRGGVVMLGSTRSDAIGVRPPKVVGAVTGGIYTAVEDIDEHYERARAAGAEIEMEPTDQDYGSRDYIARDPEGYLWSFGTYRPGRAD